MQNSLISFLCLTALLFCGCSLIPHRGKIKTVAGNQLSPPTNASAPSTLNEDFSIESLTIPAGSKIVVTQTQATASAPASKTTEFVLSKDATKRTENHITNASVAAPRAPDKTVELAKLNNDERRPILYIAIALALGAGVLLYFQQISLAEGAGILSVIAFALWWALGNQTLLIWVFGSLAAIAIGYFVYTEYRKAKIQNAANVATGTVKNIAQSIEEMAVDAPKAIETLKQEYIEPNMANVPEQKALVSALKPTIDTSYIQQAAAQKAVTVPATAPVA